jgi:hypothetical protein
LGVLLKNGIRICEFAVRNVLLLSLALLAGDCALRAQSTEVYHPPAVAPSEPLSGVRYDYRWELYGGLAYAHFNAGPNLLEGSDLGGLDLQAARWFNKRWAAAANVRGYYGTAATVPNDYHGEHITGPFVAEHLAVAGPEFRGPSNEHASLTVHALVGGAYGLFDHALGDVPTSVVGFYDNQWTFASALGGSIDLNRSPRLVFRLSPDAILTDFGSGGIRSQFAFSVGIVYRLGHVASKR